MPAISLPPNHGLRRSLADEVHARPPAPVAVPAVVSCLALFDTDANAVFDCVAQLAQRYAAETPTPSGHAIVELPDVRAKWERHGEFSSLTFVRPLRDAEADLARLDHYPTAFAAVPADWLATLPGRTVAAADIVLLPAGAGDADTLRAQVAPWFVRDALAGSRVLDDAALIFTDFVLPPDSSRTRWLVLDRQGMSRAQSARVVQRIIEIEIYRMTALLAFPLAREAFPELNRIEQRLAEITAATAALHGRGEPRQTQDEERRLLDVLTGIAAEVERSVAATSFRFSAGEAYWNLVQSRVREFREQRIGDLRTLGGFLSRRLAPAMNSCAAAERRQEELSARIERASALLRTRVDVAREEQNQQLLAAMERRGKVALRLQQTVEGLSVAALTYYLVGLVGYGVKPLKQIFPNLNPDWVVAASIPVLAFLVWRAVARLRQKLMSD
ncbi:MAG: DUF3422 domain-containing protein [Burkholderiaceae bacterium]|nr:DUF3422 domain-containing protein [Burkholderiaceae bacterium]